MDSMGPLHRVDNYTAISDKEREGWVGKSIFHQLGVTGSPLQHCGHFNCQTGLKFAMKEWAYKASSLGFVSKGWRRAFSCSVVCM